MILAIGSDHRGFEIKNHLLLFLKRMGHEMLNKGSFDNTPVDYPVIAQAVSESVASKESERGILFCGTGIGVSIAANRNFGIRAALCHNKITTRMSIEHNNANIFCFGSNILKLEIIKEYLELWLTLTFQQDNNNNERHYRRIKLIDKRGFSNEV